MTNVSVDKDACVGNTNCTFRAPNTFQLDDDGLSSVVDEQGDPYELQEQAADECPVQAIRVDRSNGTRLA